MMIDQNKFSSVGVRISSKLKQLGIKQADLCREAGISSNAISQYCTGKRIPDTTSLYKIANALGSSMEWVLTGDDTTSESLDRNVKPWSETESDLVQMYRLLGSEDRRTIFDLTTLKYEQTTGKRGSTFSMYTDINTPEINPNDALSQKNEIA